VTATRAGIDGARRAFLKGTVAVAAVGAALPAFAQGETPLAALQSFGRQAEWAERFDATMPEVAAVNSSQPTLSPEALGRMQLAIEEYRVIAAQGGWPAVEMPKKALRLGDRDRVVPGLRARLAASGDLTQQGGRSDIYDTYVSTAVRRFQLRHGLNPHGMLDGVTVQAMNVPVVVRLRQLEMNLGRIQDLSRNLQPRYVLVNIPAAEIEAVENGRVRSRHTAVVGKVDRPSPELTSRIHEINFNPYWTVPVSIVRRDLIPKMQKNPQYLTEQKIRIYKWGDNQTEYSWQQIDWNTDEATQYMFRQDPGELNSLGTVKINFYNQHDVYLHDTPQKSLFGEDARFHSSGCVRVQNVRELITWILQPNGWDRAQVDQVIRSGQRLDVKVEHSPQIMFAYITAWVNADGVVHFRNDIYNRDGASTIAYSTPG
jgi:murein L,D-transpeptidase YcbB/YkuD